MTTREWKEIGRKWKTTSSKTAILYPALEKILKNVKGKKILDAGCGDGYAVRWLTAKGAKCTGVDISQDSIESCRDIDPKGKYFVANVTNLKIKEKFDFVLSLLVLMGFNNKNRIAQAIKSMGSTLEKDGKLIISVVHPAFDIANDNMETMTRAPIGEYSYSKKGIPVVYKNNVKNFSVTDYHWMIEDYVDCIKKSNLVIEEIKEPLPVPKSEKTNPRLYLARIRSLPYIILVARKCH